MFRIFFFIFLKSEYYPQYTKPRLLVAADSLYDLKQYKTAAKEYSKAIKCLAKEPSQFNSELTEVARLNAASCWALSQVPDSAFYMLELVLSSVKPNKERYLGFKESLNQLDSELNSLKGDKRWPVLVAKLNGLIINSEKKFNLKLKNQLDSFFFKRQVINVEEKNDTSDYNFVRGILAKHGWPYSDSIGEYSADQLFKTVNNIDFVQEKYIQLLRETVKKGQAEPYMIAYLEDSWLVKQNKKQIYGTRVLVDSSVRYQMEQIVDVRNINERRKVLGLEPIEDYLMAFNKNSPIKKKSLIRKENSKLSNLFYYFAFGLLIVILIFVSVRFYFSKR